MSLADYAGPAVSLVIKGVDLLTVIKDKRKYRRIYLKEIKIEIRDNITLLRNRNKKNILKEKLIERLKDTAIRESIVVETDYNQLAKKNAVVDKKHIKRKREKVCISWDCNKLVDKVSDKITDLKNQIEIVKDFDKNKSGITQRLDNLYYQLLLLNELIKER